MNYSNRSIEEEYKIANANLSLYGAPPVVPPLEGTNKEKLTLVRKFISKFFKSINPPLERTDREKLTPILLAYKSVLGGNLQEDAFMYKQVFCMPEGLRLKFGYDKYSFISEKQVEDAIIYRSAEVARHLKEITNRI